VGINVLQRDEKHALLSRREVELHQRIQEEADRLIHELRVVAPDARIVITKRIGKPEDEFIVSPAEPYMQANSENMTSMHVATIELIHQRWHDSQAGRQEDRQAIVYLNTSSPELAWSLSQSRQLSTTLERVKRKACSKNTFEREKREMKNV
jgi:ABC-type proline/glycine betaine transport system ATPase subunit